MQNCTTMFKGIMQLVNAIGLVMNSVCMHPFTIKMAAIFGAESLICAVCGCCCDNMQMHYVKFIIRLG